MNAIRFPSGLNVGCTLFEPRPMVMRRGKASPSSGMRYRSEPFSLLSVYTTDRPSGVKTGVKFVVFRWDPKSRDRPVRRSWSTMRDSGPYVLYAIIDPAGFHAGDIAAAVLGMA